MNLIKDSVQVLGHAMSGESSFRFHGWKKDVCDRYLNVQLYQIRRLCIYHSHYWECIFNGNNQSIK